MDNREFISAANLPTTEAEEVDVLCVEGGELKRKAGASLGGGDWDAVINTNDYTNFALSFGSYEALREKAMAGGVLRIVVLANGTDDNGVMWHETYIAYAVQVPEDESEVIWVRSGYGDGLWLSIGNDNSVFID